MKRNVKATCAVVFWAVVLLLLSPIHGDTAYGDTAYGDTAYGDTAYGDTAYGDTAGGGPNIVYINVDDLGWTDLGFQGSRFYETPNIDKLASQGMVFTNAYAPAANCAPSRACCMTGQYTPRHGVYTVGVSTRGRAVARKLVPTENTLFIDDNNLTIAQVLKSSGYRTCVVGKWHISKDPTQNGFDENVAGCEWGHPKHGYFAPYKNPALEEGPAGEYLTDRLTDEAISFIQRNQSNPFFLYFPFYTVHGPLQAKQVWKDAFRIKQTTAAHKNVAYAAMIASMDENVGRLLNELERLKLTDNTVVLFTSDNGGVWTTSKQWPLRAGKGSYYEGGIREPMIVRWPGVVKAGTCCNTPVIGIDFFPTLASIAGATIPETKQLDGVSLIPLLKGQGALPDRPLFWHFPIYLQGGNRETRDITFRTRPGSVVRSGEWKLHEYYEDGGIELYNLANDVGEKKNLAEDQPDKAKELLTLLRDWREETNAPVPTARNPKYRGE